MNRPDPAHLADGLERLKERHRDTLAAPEYAVLLSAIEVLRGAATGDPLKEAAAAVLDQEEKHALGNWGGWFGWLGEFPEECVNFLRLRLALGRGVPEELESLAEVLRDAAGQGKAFHEWTEDTLCQIARWLGVEYDEIVADPEAPWVDPEKERRAAEVERTRGLRREP